MLDFNAFISGASLTDVGYIGSNFTLSNNRTGQVPVKARLDRFLSNSTCGDIYMGLKVRHLARGPSDHSPLLVTFSPLPRTPARFTFLSKWITHETFKDTVKAAWDALIGWHYNPFVILHLKLKAVIGALRIWNKATFGNINDNLLSYEEEARAMQEAFDADPSPNNRSAMGAANANLRKAVNCNGRQNSIYRLQVDGVWNEDQEKPLSCEKTQSLWPLIRRLEASSDDLPQLEDSLDIRERFPDSGVQRDSPQSLELGGFGGFLALAEESFPDLLFPLLIFPVANVVVFLLVRASRGVRSRLSSRPQQLRALYFPTATSGLWSVHAGSSAGHVDVGPHPGCTPGSVGGSGSGSSSGPRLRTMVDPPSWKG
ncbi:hypothetical protein Taro_005743, partial [Colocasia esculenta]|nr:hypothetical protein [Colocasia esculenta]